MLTDADFRAVVARAQLAPSVHNIQPARWRRDGDDIIVAADLDAKLDVGDPTQHDVGLSCGAAVEATVLALGAYGLSAVVADTWDQNDQNSWQGHRIAAHLTLQPGAPDALADQLEHRFTWRSRFADETPVLYGWARPDAVIVTDALTKDWLATRNDWASLQIMRNRRFRRELVSWMRLSPDHPRSAYDGLSRAALQMSSGTAFAARWALGPLWPVLNLLGATKVITAEANATRSAAAIVCFNVPVNDSAVAAGREYLRLCLEASDLGYAGWPMAALSDLPTTNEEVCARFSIGTGRRLVQVIRFGRPLGEAPPRARRPIQEVL